MRRLEGRVALVTGAGAGIGHAVAERFTAEGSRVLAVGRSASLDGLAEAHPDIATFRADVADAEQVSGAVAHCIECFGRIDVLCNNAGISQGGTALHQLDAETWDAIMAVNLRGAFLMLREVVVRMIEQGGGGTIINMSSVGGSQPVAGSAAYIVSKAGLNMLTRQAALEYAAHGIRVNAVAPGATRTPMIDAAAPGVIEQKEAVTPMRRLGTPDEVAAVTAFLASDDAAYVTGAIYPVDGGRCAY